MDSGSGSGGSGVGACGTSGAPPVNDPLFPCQWYLHNIGQTAFAGAHGKSGQDINWAGVAETGAGVIVAVVDSGLEIAHADLAANIYSASNAISHNFLNGSTDPTNPVTDGDHGTALAGLIGAKRNNGIGMTGVAGGASLVGFNYVKTHSPADQISGLGGATFSEGVHIFNQSYGTNQKVPITVNQLNTGLVAQLQDGTTNLRGGKGAIYVKSVGNGFLVLQDSQTTGACSRATAAGLSCQNSHMDPSNAEPYQIIVGAVNANGIKSSYSTAGSAIWVSAPGGEPGYNQDQGWTFTSPAYAYEPGIITTDQSGCSIGYSRSQSAMQRNRFQDGDPKYNPTCNYTSTFTGTSASAPIVSGVAALMLETNPDLTWRDVKHILAATATRVDAKRPAAKISLGNGSYTAEPAWTVNAAGYAFHNWYGFGRVNAGAAVEMAATIPADSWGAMSSVTGSCTVSGAGTIPDNRTTGASGTCQDVSSLTFIEAVQVTVDLTHANWGDLSIELTSPRNTRSVLQTGYNGFQYSGQKAIVLLTNAFYGESADAVDPDVWRLKVVDTISGNTGTLNSWSISVHGH